MVFVHPLLLSGLLLAGVPILVHLIMRQKPKHLPFPAFRFLLQRHRSNQRRLQLRHLLLLALRMLAIVLICLALARPKMSGQGILPTTNRPVAAVLVFDTSYSMEYTPTGGVSRLDDAKRRAQELLDTFPSGSRVAVVDTAEPGGEWEPTLSMARERISKLQLKPNNFPVTSQLRLAYDLLGRAHQEIESADEALVPFVYVFSDRTEACWDAAQMASLKQQRDRLPEPGAFAVFVDVGVSEPSDLAVSNIELAQESVPAQRPVVIRATVQATGAGGNVTSTVVCEIDGEKSPDRKSVQLEIGQPKVVTFERSGLARGLHQARVFLDPADPNLVFNNSRYVTFEVRPARRVLTIADRKANALIWQAALNAGQAFSCEVKTPAQVMELSLNDLRAYQAVCLLGVSNPEHDLWDKLAAYVHEGGGLAVVPAGAEMKVESYNGDAIAQQLLPGWVQKRVHKDGEGVLWNWNERTYAHPLLKPFQEWNQEPSIDFTRNPRHTRTYWLVTQRPDTKEALNRTLIAYADKGSPPALLEHIEKKGTGRVLMFTTRLDGQARRWQDYGELNSFYLVLAQLTAGYLAGDADRHKFNYTSGEQVQVALPATAPAPTYTVQGPGLAGADALVPRPAKGSILQISHAVLPENYRVFPQGSAEPIAAFSVNVASDESRLNKVPIEQIEELLGPGSVVPLDQQISLPDALQSRWRQPIDLFPWLMILLLLLLAVENLLANRFYGRAVPDEETQAVTT